jgi:hypothetical protein
MTMSYEEIEKALAPWTDEHQRAAQAEGWDLFTTTDSTSDVQVQRLDDPQYLPEGAPHLSCDDAAMVIMGIGTKPHHEVARRILYDHFPKGMGDGAIGREKFC